VGGGDAILVLHIQQDRFEWQTYLVFVAKGQVLCGGGNRNERGVVNFTYKII